MAAAPAGWRCSQCAATAGACAATAGACAAPAGRLAVQPKCGTKRFGSDPSGFGGRRNPCTQSVGCCLVHAVAVKY